MDRRRFLTLAGTALAAAVFSPVAAAPATARALRAPPPELVNPKARVYCGSSVNAQGRFRHYLVDGRRIVERTAT